MADTSHTTREAETEAELIRRARAGDAAAFDELVVANQDYVYGLALRTLGDQHEAENVAQEALVRAWRALPRFRGDARFRTWLYRITVNLCYNRLPKLRRRQTAQPLEDAFGLADHTSVAPPAAAERAERHAHLHRHIDTLPEQYRTLVVLRYHHGLSYDEIVSVTGMPLGTVKNGLFRARTQLREAMNTMAERE